MKVTSPMNQKLTQRARRAPRSGTVVPLRKGDRTVYAARILLKDGTRKQLRCPVGCTRERAEKDAARWQLREDTTHELYLDKQRKAGVPVEGESCDEWHARMLPIRAAALGVKDSKNMANIWDNWVSPLIGERPIASIVKADILRLRDNIEEAKAAGRIRGSSPVKLWSCICVSFRVACSTRGWAHSVKVFEADPTQGVEAPINGDRRVRPWLYPSEFDALMRSSLISFERRFAYACAAMTGLRPGELAALTWEKIDFEANTIRVTEAYDWITREVGSTKTYNGVRTIPIEPALLPWLLAERGAPDALVAPIVSDRKSKEGMRGARGIREDLERIGMWSKRFEESETGMALDFRSLRDSAATWWAIAGLDIHRIMRRLGHADIQMSTRYARVAEVVGPGVGTPFAPLPPHPLAVRSVTASVTESESQRETRSGTRDSKALSEVSPRAITQGSVASVSENDHFPTPENAANPKVTLPVTLASDVDAALALALTKAAEAGRFDVVAQLARELEARRLAGTNVVTLDAKKGGAK